MASSVSTFSLADLVDGVATRLRAQGVPVAVAFGKRRAEAEANARNEIRFIESDRDDYSAPLRLNANPPAVQLRTQAFTIDIVGRSTASGATIATHRRWVTALLHSTIAATLYVSHAKRIDVTFVDGGFVDADKEAEYGAHYELRARLPETIYDVPWATVSAPIDVVVPVKAVIDGVEFEAC